MLYNNSEIAGDGVALSKKGVTIMLNIALCDDEPFWLEKLRTCLEKSDDLNVSLSCYSSGEALLAAYQDGVRFDVLFLDMEMPGKSGMETARAIRAMGSEAVIVFVTSYERYAIEGYEVSALAYLLKSRLEEKLPRVIDMLVERSCDQESSVVIKTTQGEIGIKRREILYCEKSGHYVVVHTETDAHRSRMALSELEARIHSEQFVRCHSGFLVNLAHVRTITEKSVLMQKQGLDVPVGRGFKDDLRKAWQRYLKKEAGL